jgi:hypothetical protein
MGTPVVTADTHNELKDIAAKHGRFETFAQDMARLAEHIWHNARRGGDVTPEVTGYQKTETQPVEVTGTEPPVAESQDETVTPQKTDDEPDAPPAS